MQKDGWKFTGVQEEKLRMMQCLTESDWICTNRSAARKYGIDEKWVRERKKQLGSLNSKKKRLNGGGCKAALPDMEKELVAWIESLKAENLCVTHSNV